MSMKFDTVMTLAKAHQSARQEYARVELEYHMGKASLEDLTRASNALRAAKERLDSSSKGV